MYFVCTEAIEYVTGFLAVIASSLAIIEDNIRANGIYRLNGFYS